jgi:hypothetical protein
MFTRNRLALGALATAAFLAVVAVMLATQDRVSPARAADDPVAAVRDFLTDGVVDNNGYAACGYLTISQQNAASRRAGVMECRDAFGEAALVLGRHSIQTVHQIRQLRARSIVRGDHGLVSLERGGAVLRFRLVKADVAEQEQFLAPSSGWRIAQGGLSVIPPPPAQVQHG